MNSMIGMSLNSNSSQLICKQARHDNMGLNFVCISSGCLNKGLVCQHCVNDNHKQHNVQTLKMFLNTFKESSKLSHALPTLKRDSKLLADLQIELTHYLDSFSRSLQDVVSEAKKRILTNLECDKELIDSIMEVEQKHADSIDELEQQLINQPQQAQEKVLNLISRVNTTNPSHENTSRFAVTSFREDNQKTILLLLRKNNSIKNNIFSETPKFTKDLYMYLKQIDSALEAYDNKRTNQNNQSQLDQSTTYRSVSPMQGFSYTNKFQQSEPSPVRSASGSRVNIFARQPASNRVIQQSANNNTNNASNAQSVSQILQSPFKIATDVSENYNLNSTASKPVPSDSNNMQPIKTKPINQAIFIQNEVNQNEVNINVEKVVEQNPSNIFNIQEQFYPAKKDINNIPLPPLLTHQQQQQQQQQQQLQQPQQNQILPVSYSSNKKSNPQPDQNVQTLQTKANQTAQTGQILKQQQQANQGIVSGSGSHYFQGKPQSNMNNQVSQINCQLGKRDQNQGMGSNKMIGSVNINDVEIPQIGQLSLDDKNTNSNNTSIHLANSNNNHMRGRSNSNNQIKQFYQQPNNQQPPLPQNMINQNNYITPQKQSHTQPSQQINKSENKSTYMNIYSDVPLSNQEDINKGQPISSQIRQASPPQQQQPQVLQINTSSPLINNFNQMSKNKNQNEVFLNKSHISYMQSQHSPNSRVNTNPNINAANKSFTNLSNSPASNTSYLDLSRVAYNQNQLSSLMAHDGNIKCIELMGNDKIASGGADKLIKIWERNEYKLLNTLEGHNATVTVLKYHNMSRILASGGEDDVVIVWKPVPLLQKVHVLKGHDDSITCVTFQNERTLISCSKDLKMIIWDIEKGIGKNKLDQSDTIINDITIYNKMIMTVSDRYVQFWELSTYKLLKKVEAHDDTVNQISLIHRKRRAQMFIVTCGNDGCIYVWDGDNKYDEVDKIEEDSTSWKVHCFDYNTHYDLIVYGCISKVDASSKVVVYSLELKQITQTISHYTQPINQIRCIYKDIYIAFQNYSIDNVKIQKISATADY